MFCSRRYESEVANIDNDASLKPDRVYEERYSLEAFSIEDLSNVLLFKGLRLGRSSSLYKTN